ncbi:hypothetical protein LTR91_009118 [Friedmanniomyces endolithicus]|uniref:Homeobox domain-containing protein n=1 Tax=Friedmanniomyces endolithicus TaxID=329885 RepID=A0AAN6FC82_9PEZI|nr:hypothetical protein LTR82_014626 [Friedmanniomyces endolithicus]KAK0918159.1 hypothetical protein LTR57_011993 [Friedmanniomyces endolithicus]KAK0989852.1 hypothetical protein LTR91_009118 [Friedmanniomyces endolithicus]KAK1001211.1 hypothetical protein LTS01_004685 [Friedmanniomyces endolithicus]KAK1016769.1 hypothetical protein LTR54_002809 [Friedmanniomyces endolithicus]
MSGVPAKTDEYQWQHTPISSYPPLASTTILPQPAPPINLPGDQRQSLRDWNRPPLRSHKSFPCSLGPSSRVQEDGTQTASGGPALAQFEERVTNQGPQPVGTSNLPAATFGGSAPTSPVGRLTPNSPLGDDEQLEDEEIGFGTAEQGEEEERPPMTAAELRAHKRKMKRFRLTHNQTRFLMSEFARQPHPDAAHRERLSREIPGLSPRQVQVWFQNRRAKLKRLTTDDRERMLRSRALPVDFDMTQALHAPFGTGPPLNVRTPISSPGMYGPLGEAGGIRPLTLDTLRRGPEYEPYTQHQYSSPTGITPALGAFAFTPPQSATDTMSPASVTSAGTNYAFHAQESPRRFPFPLPMSTHTGYGPQAHIPRLHMHDRFNRPISESAGSPLRTSMSYSGAGPSSQAQTPSQERSSSFSEHSNALHDRPQQHRSLTGPSSSSSGLVGLGFTYAQMPQYATSEQQPQHHHQQQSSGMHSQHAGETQYRRSSSHLAGPPLTTYQQPYPPPPQYSSSQLPQYAGFGGHYPGQILQSAYHQQQQNHGQPHQQQQQAFAPVPSQPQQYVPLLRNASEQEGEEGDNSEGGVPLPASY